MRDAVWSACLSGFNGGERRGETFDFTKFLDGLFINPFDDWPRVKLCNSGPAASTWLGKGFKYYYLIKIRYILDLFQIEPLF